MIPPRSAIAPSFLAGMGLLIASSGALAQDRPAPRVVDFNRDIRPILSDRCYACHGPDRNKRKADLRLDTREGLLGRDGDGTVVPGQPDDSELFLRVISEDDEERMPPPKTGGKSLSKDQVALIRRWIEQGAEWKGHWAFLEPTRPEVPAGEGSAPNPVDRFVGAKLKGAGLTPAAEADRVTLIRRLSFDLIGLPPTKAEVDAFVADTSPDAYERLVDRLLASPHYGERMAIFWLDLVRYADSIGYHSDNPMNVWPFRDYVIRSFNANVPFDRFTTEQLAGDLLPDAGLAQRVASGYNRLLQTTEEGGAQAKEYAVKYAADRVRNVSTVWLAATMGCAECHDHKFDPFTQRDFYGLAAFFADIRETPVGKREPGMPVPDGRQAADLERIDDAIEALKRDLADESPGRIADQVEWEESLAGEPAWVVLEPSTARVSGESTLNVRPGGLLVTAGKVAAQEVYTIEAKTNLAGITGFRLEAIADDELPEGGPGTALDGNFLLTNFKVAASDGSEGSKPAPVALCEAVADFSQDGHPVGQAIDGDAAATGWAIAPEIPRSHAAVFELDRPIGGPDGTRLTFTLEFRGRLPQHDIGKLRLSATTTPAPSARWLPDDVRKALAMPRDRRSKGQAEVVAAYYRSLAPGLQGVRDEIVALHRSREKLIEAMPSSLVATSGRPRITRLLPRGNWMDDSGPVVGPSVPRFLRPLGVEGRRPTRLDLARWMVARDNPLTARVFVNRHWKMYFGQGLAKVLDDLGSQGEWPTHPELLDWLAVEFMESGWDVKHMVKLLVLSDSYRRTSRPTAELKERDPYNRLFGRQSPFRLDAELVRDNALAISGLLAREVGGPSVKPYQPAGYWDQLNFPKREWQHDEGDALHRRGLYTHWQRTFPHPSLLAFDAPSREECTAERARSNIPQQALVLLNDPTYVEAARAFAERIVREGGTGVEDRLAWAFGHALSRAPSEEEAHLLSGLYRKHAEQYCGDPESARSLLKVGDRPVPGDLDPGELAAWTSVARVLLNLHETITRS